MRLGERYQVSNCPSHHVAVALQEAGAWLLRSQHSRNISCHGWFFGNDGDYSGLACLHLTVSILVVGQARPIEFAANSFSLGQGDAYRQLGFGKRTRSGKASLCCNRNRSYKMETRKPAIFKRSSIVFATAVALYIFVGLLLVLLRWIDPPSTASVIFAKATCPQRRPEQSR